MNWADMRSEICFFPFAIVVDPKQIWVTLYFIGQ